MRFLTLAAAVLLASSASAQASIFIDTFDVPPGGQSVIDNTAGDGAEVDENPVAYDTAEVIGGFRELSIEKLSPAPPNNQASETAQFIGPDGVLSVSNNAGNTSIAMATWDGQNSDGLGLNLVEALAAKGTTVDDSAILIDVIEIDLSFTLSFTVTDADGTMSTISKTGINSGQVVVKPLPDFNNGAIATIVGGDGVIDWTNIESFVLTATSDVVSVDLIIDFVKIGSLVPEPASMALMGLGGLLAGCGVIRRKRKSAEELAA